MSKRLQKLLAVWRWPKWSWPIVVATLLLIYFLSAVPALSMLEAVEYRLPPRLISATDTIYSPALALACRSRCFASIWNFECVLMVRLIGTCCVSIAGLEEMPLP